MNSSGERGSPCRSPLPCIIGSRGTPLSSTREEEDAKVAELLILRDIYSSEFRPFRSALLSSHRCQLHLLHLSNSIHHQADDAEADAQHPDVQDLLVDGHRRAWQEELRVGLDQQEERQVGAPRDTEIAAAPAATYGALPKKEDGEPPELYKDAQSIESRGGAQ